MANIIQEINRKIEELKGIYAQEKLTLEILKVREELAEIHKRLGLVEAPQEQPAQEEQPPEQKIEPSTPLPKINKKKSKARCSYAFCGNHALEGSLFCSEHQQSP